jgi:hypothetical protein
MRYKVELENIDNANNTKIIFTEATSPEQAAYKAEESLNPNGDYLLSSDDRVYITVNVTEVRE